MNFPVEIIKPTKAEIHSLLWENSAGHVDLFYGIELKLQLAKLLDEEEEWARELTVSHMPLNQSKDWRGIGGSYQYGADEVEGYLPIAHEWHPVDCRRIELEYLKEGQFSVSCDLFLDLEASASGYLNVVTSVLFVADFVGLEFQIQNFSEDSGIADLSKFVSEHVDRAVYGKLVLDGAVAKLNPALGD